MVMSLFEMHFREIASVLRNLTENSANSRPSVAQCPGTSADGRGAWRRDSTFLIGDDNLVTHLDLLC